MVVQLIVTPGMIKCFHECTAKGNYQQLFKEYSQFFASLEENVGEVSFEDQLPSTIVDEFSFFRNFIYAWEPNTRLPLNKNSLSPDHCMLNFLPRLCLAMQTRNWDDFYEKYLPTIDLLIEEARKQKVFDLKIGFGSDLYDTFSLRDTAANLLSQEKKVEEDPQIHRVSALCSSGHSSPFDCNSNCIRFLRSLYGSKRVSRRKPVDESPTSTRPKSVKHVTFVEPETEKSENSGILERPEEIVASKAVKHEVPTEITKKPEGAIKDIPIKLVPSSAPDVKETVLTGVPEVKESGSTSITEVKHTVPTEINKIKELGSTSVPAVKEFNSTNVSEAKESVPSGVTEVKKTISAKTTEVKEVGPTSVKEIEPVKTAEVRQTIRTSNAKQFVPNKTPEVKQKFSTNTPAHEFGSTRVAEVKDAPKVSSEPETEDFQVNQKEDIIRLESKFQKLLKEHVDLLRFEMDRKQKNLETRIIFLEENVKTVEIKQKTFDQKLQQMASQFESSMGTKLQKLEENWISKISQNKPENQTKQFELLEEKLQFRELILHQKIDEIKIREQILDNRMNELTELMERKMANSGEKKLPEESQVDSHNTDKKKTPEKTEEDIDFDRKLAEQLLDYEERLRRIQKKRKEMNDDS